MDNIVVRTDLAVEANEEAMNGTGKLRGIKNEKNYYKGWN